jgi:hypothetical protein
MVKKFSRLRSVQPALGPIQPPIQWVSGVLLPGIKRPGRETDHSPPASAEVKKTWIYTSTPPYVFMAYNVNTRTSKVIRTGLSFLTFQLSLS